ncbi:conserved hypothetical protein [Neospora caninum Liverpool]|uniref:Utp11 n=1 Tax=Neospora caninum (strain Liverpool) TaxID=572307 RepID=F0VJ58_NEOCL|nr:conserved hypothetical protein [Neospora caninum Liverpool]CBZ53769.1 conserved hypothetical protein [Neospora caninum Liverpool]|eukprot:XP_003883801.1 conserved hypothetical protein [Neospora caninum Liverpool]
MPSACWFCFQHAFGVLLLPLEQPHVSADCSASSSSAFSSASSLSSSSSAVDLSSFEFPSPTWREIVAATRLCASVSKRLLLALPTLSGGAFRQAGVCAPGQTLSAILPTSEEACALERGKNAESLHPHRGVLLTHERETPPSSWVPPSCTDPSCLSLSSSPPGFEASAPSLASSSAAASGSGEGAERRAEPSPPNCAFSSCVEDRESAGENAETQRRKRGAVLGTQAGQGAAETPGEAHSRRRERGEEEGVGSEEGAKRVRSAEGQGQEVGGGVLEQREIGVRTEAGTELAADELPVKFILIEVTRCVRLGFLTMSNSKNLIQRRAYRERTQDARRSHKYPFLEKKQDWKVRSRRYKTQQRLIAHLAEKARTRNEEEFSFRMLKAKQVGGGVDKLKGKSAGQTFLLTPEQAAFSKASAQLVSRKGQEKVQERRKGRRRREEEALRYDQKLVDLKRQTLRKRIEKTLTHAAVLAGQADPHKGQSVSLEDADDSDDVEDEEGDDQSGEGEGGSGEGEDESEEGDENEGGDNAESEEETDKVESDEDGETPCRWLRRQRGGAKRDEESDSGSSEGFDGFSDEGSDSVGSDEETGSAPTPGRKTRKGNASLQPRNWLEGLAQDTQHARRLTKLAAKLQLKSDLAGKGRRKLVREGHAGEPPVYKWATERKK